MYSQTANRTALLSTNGSTLRSELKSYDFGVRVPVTVLQGKVLDVFLEKAREGVIVFISLSSASA